MKKINNLYRVFIIMTMFLSGCRGFLQRELPAESTHMSPSLTLQDGGIITITIPGRNPIVIKDADLFRSLDIDGATYKLTGNISINHTLTVPRAAKVILDLNGFVIQNLNRSSVFENYGHLTVIDSRPSFLHKYSVGKNGLYTLDEEK